MADANVTETDCLNCCFSEVREGEQWECELGRLAKYKEQGAKIVLDDGVYRILDRNCSAFRQKTWREHRHDKTIDQLAEEVYSETRQTFSIIIVVDQNHSLEDVKKSLASLTGAGDYLDRVVVTICNNVDLHGPILNYLIDDWTMCAWDVVVVQPLEDRLEGDFGNSTYQMAVHDGVATVKSDWYTAAYAGYRWNTSLFAKLDKYVNVDIGRVGVIGPERKSDGFIAFTKFHNHPWIGGMFEKPIYKKVMNVAKEENLPYLYMTHKQFKDLTVG